MTYHPSPVLRDFGSKEILMANNRNVSHGNIKVQSDGTKLVVTVEGWCRTGFWLHRNCFPISRVCGHGTVANHQGVTEPELSYHDKVRRGIQHHQHSFHLTELRGSNLDAVGNVKDAARELTK